MAAARLKEHYHKKVIPALTKEFGYTNVMIVCPGCNKAVRMAHHIEQVAGGKTRRTRVCRKCGQTLDKK